MIDYARESVPEKKNQLFVFLLSHSWRLLVGPGPFPTQCMRITSSVTQDAVCMLVVHCFSFYSCQTMNYVLPRGK